MKKTEISAATLVSKIYEKIQAPHMYQGLTAREENNLSGFELTGEEAHTPIAGTLPPELLAELTPHLEQAIALMESQHEHQNIQPVTPEISLYDLPVPICLISDRLQLLQVNRQAQGMLIAGVQLPYNAAQALALDQAVKKDIFATAALAMKTNTTQTVTFNAEPEVVRTVLVAPQNPNENNTAQQAALLFLNHESRIGDLAMALVDTHDLTQSEAEVAAYLAQGFAPEEIAERKNISVNTVRTQIKQVFRKTKTTRQAQLVSLVLNGPAVWTNILSNGSRSNSNSTTCETPAEVLLLDDGRKMSYGDFGPRNGIPVVLFHHLFGSRNDKPDDETVLDRLGIRLIIPERPGVGLSCSKERISLLGTAEDVRQLLDKLQIERCHIAGLSAGAPYAAAFATVMEDRAINLGIIAAQMPIEELPKGVKIGTIHRFLTSVARYFPSMAVKQLESNYKKLLADPAEMLDTYKKTTNPADKQLHQDPKINQIRLRNIQQAATRNPSIYAHQLVTEFRSWGFKLSELKVPVILWHGKQDELYPYEHARAMAEIIPNCKTVFNDLWGHFFPLKEWESIYQTLIE